jgi:hypothetical protein
VAWAVVCRSDGNAAAPRSRMVARSVGPGSRRRYPQIISAHVDDEVVADRIESNGTITGHADVAAEFLRSIGHPDAVAHRPHV